METKPISTKLTRNTINNTLLVEIAWEVVNQVGGIYTVIRSKAPTISKKWGNNYCVVGPYMGSQVNTEFEEIDDVKDHFGKAVFQMRQMGFDVKYGYWLVSGRPKTVLFNLQSIMPKITEVKYLLWENHGIATPAQDYLLDGVIAFGELAKIFVLELTKVSGDKTVLAHFHEWMAGSGIPGLRKLQSKAKIIFTTHATMLGRYLAMNDPLFYDHLPFLDWAKEAKHFNIESSVNIERAAAHGAHVFTTVSEVTARECRQFLGRNPDVIVPNGINNQRFEALHEFQNLHLENKLKINQFTMSHFFKSYNFDLDKTLYFFTSGRYEYSNKGYDLTLAALARLNQRLIQEKIDVTIVMFFVTKAPFHNFNPQVLESMVLMEELKRAIGAIQKQVGERMFQRAATAYDNKMPNLNEFIDEYWKLRYRRLLQSWKKNTLPPVVTHILHDDANDPILKQLRNLNLVNQAHDRVKVVYHPDFITYTNPLFGIDYGQFVRGCHLGIFPSYYEPWGYTPLECIASGVPTITSDLAGFGDFVQENIKDHDKYGIWVVKRAQRSFDQAAIDLAGKMYRFITLNRRQRIDLRNRTEGSSVLFDWNNLVKHYDTAYLKAVGE